VGRFSEIEKFEKFGEVSPVKKAPPILPILIYPFSTLFNFCCLFARFSEGAQKYAKILFQNGG
jgi:hypothetical protein